MTAFLDQVADMKVALVQTPAVAPLVRFGRSAPMPEGTDEGVFLMPRRSVGDRPHVGTEQTDWDSDVEVFLYARGRGGDDGITAVDALLGRVFERLSPWITAPQIAWDVDEANTALGQAVLRFRIQQRTADGSLAAAT